jgi:hypothetical protein
MKLTIKNPNHCLYCGKGLSVFHLLRDSLYCNSSHRSVHMGELDKLALSRLLAEEKSPSAIRWEQCERRMELAEALTHRAVL